MEANNIKVFETQDELVAGAAEAIISIANKAVNDKGKFFISLSGGHTPERLYTTLAKEPYISQMPWRQTFIFWGEERCVPADDEQNNANMAKRTLLSHIKIPAFDVFPVQTELPPKMAAEAYEEDIETLLGDDGMHFDLILLGLGENGHTASLFPGTDVVREKDRMVKEVYVAEQDMYRITMTAPLINKARNILFLAEGYGKADIINKVLNGSYLPDTFPAQLIKPSNGQLYWYLDVKAAKFLA